MTSPRDPMPEHFQSFYILPGERVGAYVIRKAIGQGASQVAYLANAPGGRRVVLKMSLFPKGEEESGNRKMHERFLRQVTSFLNLRGTLGVAGIFAHDMFPDHSESGHAYLVQEWIPGSVNVVDWYRNEPHKLKAILGGWITLANACAEMTRRGICHRDLKPENILMTPQGFPKIVDFDSAMNVGAEPLTTPAPGGWPGTKLYYSPEVCEAMLSDWTTVFDAPFEELPTGDLHALGVIFYQVLTGKHPFDENASPQELLKQIAYEVPERPRTLNPLVPFGLDKVTMKLLQKNPEQRYQFGDQVVADLEALLGTGEDWERPFQTPARERHPSSPRTSRTSPSAATPRTCEGSAALDLAPAAIVLAPPRALRRLEPAPSALVSLSQPPIAATVEPAPRRAPRRRLALLLAPAVALALVATWPLLRQHEAAGPVLEKGTMFVGQVKTAVVAGISAALSACVGLGKVRTGERDWLATCPAESRKAVNELGLETDTGLAWMMAGPNVIIPDDGGVEVRDGPLEVKAAISTMTKAYVGRLYGEIRTGADGAVLHFTKFRVVDGTEAKGQPPQGPEYDVCAYAAARGYGNFPGISKVTRPRDPTAPRTPGYLFITTGALEIHFAH